MFAVELFVRGCIVRSRLRSLLTVALFDRSYKKYVQQRRKYISYNNREGVDYSSVVTRTRFSVFPPPLVLSRSLSPVSKRNVSRIFKTPRGRTDAHTSLAPPAHTVFTRPSVKSKDIPAVNQIPRSRGDTSSTPADSHAQRIAPSGNLVRHVLDIRGCPLLLLRYIYAHLAVRD